jgi:hypothetical protein
METTRPSPFELNHNRIALKGVTEKGQRKQENHTKKSLTKKRRSKTINRQMAKATDEA